VLGIAGGVPAPYGVIHGLSSSSQCQKSDTHPVGTLCSYHNTTAPPPPHSHCLRQCSTCAELLLHTTTTTTTTTTPFTAETNQRLPEYTQRTAALNWRLLGDEADVGVRRTWTALISV
jgi:hypothetical protein